jgi:indolepyruvate ferredoxin oxidoreductase
VATGDADALIGGDIIVSASPDALTRMTAGRTRVVVNCARTPTADFTRNPDWQFPLERMQAVIGEAVGETAAHFIDASDLAFRLLGDSIAGNLFLLGYAWQKGLVPVSWEAMDRAIELNGTAVAMSRAAFLWGRRAALDVAAVAARAAPKSEAPPPPSLDELIAGRERMLTDYQDAAYAARYRELVDRVRGAETTLGSTALTAAVARCLYKLMAIKDEYEVARLYTEGDFRRKLDEVFDGNFSLRIHLAPPLLARPDPKTGHVAKMSFGPWMFGAFRWLAKARRWRGTAWDVFGRSAERRLERRLLADYETDIAALLPSLSAATLDDALALANLPDAIRGFGHVRRQSIDAAGPQRDALRKKLGLN